MQFFNIPHPTKKPDGVNQEQGILEPFVVDNTTLELAVKTAKQGNVHRMT